MLFFRRILRIIHKIRTITKQSGENFSFLSALSKLFVKNEKFAT